MTDIRAGWFAVSRVQHASIFSAWILPAAASSRSFPPIGAHAKSHTPSTPMLFPSCRRMLGSSYTLIPTPGTARATNRLSELHFSACFPPFESVAVGKVRRSCPVRTSHTATVPSCDATAYLVPSDEKAAEKEATKAVDAYGRNDTSGGGSDSVAIGVMLIWEPPVSRWRKTLEVSPTESKVRPSGDTEAI